MVGKRMLSSLAAILVLILMAGVNPQEEVTGPVKIYDTVYEQVDPGPPFTEAPRTVEDWQPPEPTDEERKSGFIVFTRPEPFDIKPWSRPKPEERVSHLSCFAAKGQTTSLWLAVYALEPLSRFELTVQTRSRKKPVPEVTPLYAHFWAQRTDWRGRTYYITPELLLPMGRGTGDEGRELGKGEAMFPAKGGTLERRPLDIPKGETRLFWLTVKVPKDADAGEYKFTLTLKGEGKAPLQLNLTVRVLPFHLLKPPEKRWLLYSDSGLWGRLSDEKVLAILQDIADHGIDGLTDLPFGKLDLSQLKEGIVRYEPEPLLRMHQLMKQVGLKGPHTIGVWAEWEAVRVLGLQVDLNKEWDERLKEAMRLIARTVVETLKPHKIDWLFYGWDEPGPENLQALQQYRCWHEGGAKTYVTFYQRATYDVAGQWMTAPCFSVGLINRKETAEWARKACDERGQKFFWYGSGCYLGQEGRMFPNRYLTGWLFWKTKADAQVSWTFVRPHEDPFNDFDGSRANRVEPKDQCTAYPHFERPNDPNSMVGIITTIQWEAIREGIADYCYAYTLQNLIEYAHRLAEAVKEVIGQQNRWAMRLKEIADESEKLLATVEESVPWGNEVRQRGYTNADLQQVRGLIAKQIERLVMAIGGEKLAGSRRQQRLVLRFRFLPPENSPVSRNVPLPVLNIPRLREKPKIDGVVDESEWRDAGVAYPFHEHQTGAIMPRDLDTKAFVGYDDRALYIAFVCREPKLERIKAAKWARDNDGVWRDESVEVFIADPESPNRYAHIIVNASGAIYDEFVFDKTWNAELQVATSVGKEEWSCEMAISWSSLPLSASKVSDGQTLRLNLCRNRNLIGEGASHWAWSPTFGWFHTPERFGFGRLTDADVFVTSIAPPRLFGEKNLTVKLRNRGREPMKVKLDGQEVTIPSDSTKTVQVPVNASVGEHEHTLRLRIRDDEQVWRIPYVIPEPLRLVSPTVIANERNEATLTMVVNLSDKLRWKSTLNVEVADTRFSVPLREEKATSLLSVSSSLLTVKLSLPDVPMQPLIATIFLP
ncbi:Carbohydrate family 9 binding domain-like [Candidatus Fervidibacteria bacterium JGI MDM2 SSWTFF-3-K9]